MTIKPGDFTGKQRKELADANAEELAQTAKQMSMIQQVEVETNELDAFDGKTGASVGRAAALTVDPTEDYALIKVVEDIQDMTFGVGNNFSFEVGKQYKVPMDLAVYLDGLGYVWGGVQKVATKK
jgi:hypothetical protein